MYCLPGGRKVPALGISTREGACTRRNIIFIVHNDHPHSGPFAAAHELGHILGSPHDGSESSRSCSAGDGHVMTPSLVFEPHPVWSECSKNAIEVFLRKPAALCLFRRRCPETTIAGEAGSRVDPDEEIKKLQCMVKMNENDEFLNATVIDSCILTCYVTLQSTNQIGSFERSAPNGMQCNVNGVCKECQEGICTFKV
ncbi:zinc metalloproteinase/disintegrin-like [Rhipicephalus microplus]|uniref:zinc metalloproteinase/disintegrin-like n=1 Tax=Rhipicephalus microplus TaxID=6941 RepID=UPI003F6B0D69